MDIAYHAADRLIERSKKKYPHCRQVLSRGPRAGELRLVHDAEIGVSLPDLCGGIQTLPPIGGMV
jgi:hypothetical protein